MALGLIHARSRAASRNHAFLITTRNGSGISGLPQETFAHHLFAVTAMEKKIRKRIDQNENLKLSATTKRFERNPYFPVMECAAGPIASINGQEKINLGSNNYLGLATDARVIRAAKDAVDRWGTGVTGSRLLNGTTALHCELEEAIAAFLGKEAALVTPTGYVANLALIAGLSGLRDTIVVDDEAHASIIDGVALAHARVRRFTHNDPQDLQALLEKNPAIEICIVEGVYSMRGDASPLAELAAVCEAHGVLLVDDEAHGIGVTGPTGRGTYELVPHGVDVVTMTFSKTLASCGGAIVGDRRLIDTIRYNSRPFHFTASNTPASVATALEALRILDREPQLVSELQEKSEFFKQALHARGIAPRHSDSAIVTVPIGSNFKVLQVWRMLWNRGVFCHPVVAPAVPANEGLLRMSVMRTHEPAQLLKAADLISSIQPLLEADAA